MNNKNRELLLEYLQNILSGSYTGHFNISELDEPYRELGQGLKAIHQKLNLLTEREEEVLKIQQHAEMVESYNELLVQMLSKRNEWLLVVDQNSQEILYCNKQKKNGTVNESFCGTCKNRLSFQSELLNWKASEQYSVREINSDNDTYYRVTSFPIEWKEHNSLVHIIVDITDEKRTAHNLTSKAYHDPGTGIKNRLFFKEYMESILREHREATLCYLDLDGLKYVNDKFGHLEGDIYIQNFVELIRSSFRNGDTFARIGGDEFCLVLTGCSGDLIERKIAEILKRFQSERYNEYQCSFSYGVVEITGRESDASLDDILHEADEIMYECKRKNKEKYPELVR
ncbi:MAG: GGDEF domain-containing protein [Dorea sp.]|jgi:diguanylate cyclase (GGDEF)-like protein|nr:GGDEF domain-containing protein [Dorea sp.]